MKVAVTTSSFAKFSSYPLDLLKEAGWECVLNSYGRALKVPETVDLLKGCEAVIAGTERYDKEVLAALPDLKGISRVGVGMDAIDLELCEKKGVKVFNTPDAPTRPVAELVIGVMLDLLRKISCMDRELRSGVWKKHMGSLLKGKTIGVIGLGRIGKEVARLCSAFDANILVYDPFIDHKDTPRDVVAVGFNELLNKSDVISLHVPYNEATHHIIGKKGFLEMKGTAYLVNCARGGLVDEGALIEALDSKKISGAALDVFGEEPYDGPLKVYDNVILTPHIGSYAREARIQMEQDAVENLLENFK